MSKAPASQGTRHASPPILAPSPGVEGLDLPPPGPVRWISRRKAEVVAAVRTGALSLDEACRRYTLSVEEFLTWERLFDAHGLGGLRATRTTGNRRRRGAPAGRQELPTR